MVRLVLRAVAIAAVLLTMLIGCQEQTATSPSAPAGWVEGGLPADKRGDYATVVSEWRPLAEQGDIKAQIDLGLMYAEGRDGPQDYIRAHMWFNLAASRLPLGKWSNLVD
jgi:hypothetical protein